MAELPPPADLALLDDLDHADPNSMNDPLADLLNPQKERQTTVTITTSTPNETTSTTAWIDNGVVASTHTPLLLSSLPPSTSHDPISPLSLPATAADEIPMLPVEAVESLPARALSNSEETQLLREKSELLRERSPKLPYRPAMKFTPEISLSDVGDAAPAAGVTMTTTTTAAAAIPNVVQQVKIVEEDIEPPPPLPYRDQDGVKMGLRKRLSWSAKNVVNKQKGVLRKVKSGVIESWRKQVDSTKEFVHVFTEPYVPAPVHYTKSLSIRNMREAGSRFQDAVEPYIDCIEAVIRVSRWEDPYKTGGVAIIYFWSWYTSILSYLLVASPLLLLLTTYALHQNLFPSLLHPPAKTKPAEAATTFGAAAGFASAATESIGFAVHAAPASAAAASEGLEKFKNLVSWKAPDKTLKAGATYAFAIIALSMIPPHLIISLAELAFGWYFFILLGLKHHFPAFAARSAAQGDMVSRFFEGVPSDADIRAAEEEERRRERERLEVALGLAEKPVEKLYETPCILTHPTSILDSSYGDLIITPDTLHFQPRFENSVANPLDISWTDVTGVSRVRVKSWVLGDGRGIRVTVKSMGEGGLESEVCVFVMNVDGGCMLTRM
ncbi:uncharacterized protein EV422DRAFT_335765 [Fimicolochytrium jonesii]|uniref:uncharacterized protein n=1 Tax=Fimicolochytrium jonesii TaxID=1396493 RepID=UPI0022FEC4BB|nr:uncharacterized protein EV422DRAFT_335765 [Fimicolochytrium jonesii]KAI8815916.1 hypothetical protein EV422DRAFT_335765 [Fimicolochytrium jonesii]